MKTKIVMNRVYRHPLRTIAIAYSMWMFSLHSSEAWWLKDACLSKDVLLLKRVSTMIAQNNLRHKQQRAARFQRILAESVTRIADLISIMFEYYDDGLAYGVMLPIMYGLDKFSGDILCADGCYYSLCAATSSSLQQPFEQYCNDEAFVVIEKFDNTRYPDVKDCLLICEHEIAASEVGVKVLSDHVCQFKIYDNRADKIARMALVLRVFLSYYKIKWVRRDYDVPEIVTAQLRPCFFLPPYTTGKQFMERLVGLVTCLKDMRDYMPDRIFPDKYRECERLITVYDDKIKKNPTFFSSFPEGDDYIPCFY